VSVSAERSEKLSGSVIVNKTEMFKIGLDHFGLLKYICLILKRMKPQNLSEAFSRTLNPN